MDLYEDEIISHAHTEDSLLSSRNSSETAVNRNKKNCCCYLEQKKNSKYLLWCYLLFGIGFIIWSICTIIWSPVQLFMEERLRMTRGLPPYEWWKNPPDEVYFSVYLFNITNSEQFLNDPTIKLNVEEIGPITYMEKLRHIDVVFNDNGTLSYTAVRKPIYIPELNKIDLNATIIMPNWAVLGIASYLWDQSIFIKLGYNLLMRSLKPQIFVQRTVYDVLWNLTDPFLDASRSIAPFLIPINNMGVLSRIYSELENRVTVYVGTKYGNEKFFLIDKYDGSEYLPKWGEQCNNDKVLNSTEGITYPQMITPNTTIKYWRNTLCKTATLKYTRNLTKFGLDGYRYDLPETAFDRTVPEEFDCFKMEPTLPNGLLDVSKCHFNFPIAASFPHFLHGDPILKTYVNGLIANETKHSSYLEVEPITGVPLISRAASQCNLVIRQLKGFHNNVTRFGDIAIPMFWMEYYQVGLPWYIVGLVYFQVKILPIFQHFFTAFLLIIGIILLRLYRKFQQRQQQLLLLNKQFIFDQQLFTSNKV